MARHDYGDPTPASTAYIGIVGTLIFVLTVIYLTALYYQSEQEQWEEKIVAETPQTVISSREEHHRIMGRLQDEKMQGYQYDHNYERDGERGRVSIPVDEAKEKLLEEWSKGQ